MMKLQQTTVPICCADFSCQKTAMSAQNPCKSPGESAHIFAVCSGQGRPEATEYRKLETDFETAKYNWDKCRKIIRKEIVEREKSEKLKMAL